MSKREGAKLMPSKKDVTANRARLGRRTKNQKRPPKNPPDLLPGYVEARMVKCGKAGCKCSRGELHGPYFYHRTRAASVRSKSYVRLADVRGVRRACQNYRELQAQLREGQETFKALLARAREILA
jgi:hypothetical protein